MLTWRRRAKGSNRGESRRQTAIAIGEEAFRPPCDADSPAGRCRLFRGPATDFYAPLSAFSENHNLDLGCLALHCPAARPPASLVDLLCRLLPRSLYRLLRRQRDSRGDSDAGRTVPLRGRRAGSMGNSAFQQQSSLQDRDFAPGVYRDRGCPDPGHHHSSN